MTHQELDRKQQEVEEQALDAIADLLRLMSRNRRVVYTKTHLGQLLGIPGEYLSKPYKRARRIIAVLQPECLHLLAVSQQITAAEWEQLRSLALFLARCRQEYPPSADRCQELRDVAYTIAQGFDTSPQTITLDFLEVAWDVVRHTPQACDLVIAAKLANGYLFHGELLAAQATIRQAKAIRKRLSGASLFEKATLARSAAWIQRHNPATIDEAIRSGTDAEELFRIGGHLRWQIAAGREKCKALAAGAVCKPDEARRYIEECKNHLKTVLVLASADAKGTRPKDGVESESLNLLVNASECCMGFGDYEQVDEYWQRTLKFPSADEIQSRSLQVRSKFRFFEPALLAVRGNWQEARDLAQRYILGKDMAFFGDRRQRLIRLRDALDTGSELRLKPALSGLFF